MKNMNPTGLLLMGIAMIFIAVGFIVYPIIITATDALLAYENSTQSSLTAASFTGFTAVIGITPLLVLIGFVMAGVFTGFLGVRKAKMGGGSNVKPLGLLMLSISIIFIAIGLIILPVVLDGVSGSLIHQQSQTDTETGISTGVGVTTANTTLTQTLFNNSVSEVTSVTSNISESSLAASSFTSPNLLLTGLTANTTRTIVTVYDYADLLANYSGLYTVLLITPLLVIISFLAASVVFGFMGVKRIGA